MSAWRREAIRLVPELRDEIEKAWSPMAAAIEMNLHYDSAIEAGDLATTKRVIDYARWCWDSHDPDVYTAGMVGFAEAMAMNKAHRDALPKLISREEYRELRPAMAYHTAERHLSALDRAFGLYK